MAPINYGRFVLVETEVGLRMRESALPRHELHAPPCGQFQVCIRSDTALQAIAQSSGTALPMEMKVFRIPSWPEDQYESVKRAVVEFCFVRYGCRPATTCFHLEEMYDVWEGTLAYRAVTRRDCMDDVWEGTLASYRGVGELPRRVIDVVFDWGPHLDRSTWWATWPPAAAVRSARM